MAGLFCVRATISCRALSAHTTAPRQGWRDGSVFLPSTELTALMALRTAGLLPIWRWGSTNTGLGFGSTAGHSPSPHQVAGTKTCKGVAMQKVERHIKRTITKLAKRLNPDEE